MLMTLIAKAVGESHLMAVTGNSVLTSVQLAPSAGTLLRLPSTSDFQALPPLITMFPDL
ncbi:hypothetical protein D3C78_1784420 [compost metagenome]